MIEILIVIALLAILLLAGWLVYITQVAKARDSRRKADLYHISVALRTYYEDKLEYPDEGILDNCGSAALAPYMAQIPCDPINSSSFKYAYVKTGVKSFRVYVNLENNNDPVIAAIGCSGGCGPDNNYDYFIADDSDENTGLVGEGVEPDCGTNIKYCFPNVCGACCPGANFRCNGSGSRCIADISCNE